MNCLVCEKPMIPNGGLQYYHGGCRKERTKYLIPQLLRMKKQKKHEEVKEEVKIEKVIPKTLDKRDNLLQKMLKYIYNTLVRIFIRGN